MLYSSSTNGRFSSVIYPEHSAGNRQDTGPVWSPDGFRMAFVTDAQLDQELDGASTAENPEHAE